MYNICVNVVEKNFVILCSASKFSKKLFVVYSYLLMLMKVMIFVEGVENLVLFVIKVLSCYLNYYELLD